MSRTSPVTETEDLIFGLRQRAAALGTNYQADIDFFRACADALATSLRFYGLATTGLAQCGQQPVAWQYRVMYDPWHARKDEWCEWRDAGEKYFNKVNADIAAGATRVQTRALCVADTSTVRQNMVASDPNPENIEPSPEPLD